MHNWKKIVGGVLSGLMENEFVNKLLQVNRERCVGMAANMIGVKKNIIIVNMGFIDVVMFNPVIVSKHDMYEMPSSMRVISMKETKFVSM